MYFQVGFSPKITRLLIRKQVLDSPERLRVHMDKNVDDICNVMRNPGGMNADRMPDRRK